MPLARQMPLSWMLLDAVSMTGPLLDAASMAGALLIPRLVVFFSEPNPNPVSLELLQFPVAISQCNEAGVTRNCRWNC